MSGQSLYCYQYYHILITCGHLHNKLGQRIMHMDDVGVWAVGEKGDECLDQPSNHPHHNLASPPILAN